MNFRRTGGLTLVEIMVVVMIIGLLVAISIPSFLKSRETTQKQLCFENQRLIRDMLVLYCLDNSKVPTLANFPDIEAVKSVIVPAGSGGNNRYLKDSTAFDCPAQGDGSENDYALVVVDDVILEVRCIIESEHNE